MNFNPNQRDERTATEMKHKLFRILALFTLLPFSFVACKQQPATDSSQNQSAAREHVAGTRGGALTYRVVSPPQTFNYLMGKDTDTLAVAFFLLGGRLVAFDHDKQSYAPALAESWKMRDDGKTLDLTLRDGLRFSDGHTLTADDVLFTFRAIYDERTASPIFRDAMTIGNKQITVSAVDARRLMLVFPETIATPESYLANVAVLPRHVLEEDLNKGTLKDAYSLTSDPQRIVTAGAFTVEQSTPGERAVLKRNPNYWKKDEAGTQLPYLDTLTVEAIGDANNSIARLQQGTLDIVDRIRPTDYAALRGGQGQVRAFDLGPGLITDHFWFNLNEGAGPGGKPFVDMTKQTWFKDSRFRRAISYAIDRETIANVTLQGLATPLYGFVSPGNRAWVADDIPRTEYNLDTARAMLKDAGFKVGGTESAPEITDSKGNPVEFTLIVPAESEPRKAMAAVIQEDLAKLGIKMQIAPLEGGQVTLRAKESYDYDAILLGTSASEPDPSSYTNFLRSDSAEHSWHPKQAKPANQMEAFIDEATNEQAHETNIEKRRLAFNRIQVMMADYMPVIPIVARHVTSAANTRVGNYRPSAIFPYSLWNAEELFVRK